MSREKYRAQAKATTRALHALIVERCRELKIPQEEVALRGGVTGRYFRALAHGGDPGLSTLLGLADAVGVDVVELLASAIRRSVEVRTVSPTVET